MTRSEITISEALSDPFIRLLLRANRVALENFAKLLKDAAIRRRQSTDQISHLHLGCLH